jgi:hypothetical protein
LLLLIGQAANAQECKNLPRSEVNIYRLRVETVTETVAPADVVVRQMGGGDPANAPHPLMAVTYALDSKVATEHQLIAADGGYCDVPETLRIGFGIATRKVVLADTAAKDGCIREALLEHEADHYRISQEIIQKFIERRSPQFAQEILSLEAARSPDEATATKAFQSGLWEALARFLADFEKESVKDLKSAVDTAPRLASLRTACEGRLAKMEAKIRGKDL